MTTVPQPHLNRAITLLSIAAFGSSAAARLGDPMLPELIRVFAAPPAEVAHVVSAFSITYGIVQAFFGPLGDRVGKYRMVGFATLASTLGAAGAALASGLDWLVLSRLVAGVLAAGVIPLSMAWIGDTVPYERRQATLARFLAGQILGVIGGQVIGGVFTDLMGWRSAFAFLAAVYLVVGLAVLAEAGSNPHARHRPETHAANGGVLAQAVEVLRQPWARVILLVVFLEGGLVFGALAFVPSYLHLRFGLSLGGAGGLMALFGAGGLSYITVAKRLLGRLGETGLALWGGAVLCAAWAILALAPAWGWAAPAAYLAGLGYYMLHNTLQTNATQMAPKVRGTAVSLFASMFFLGQSLGVMAAAALLDRLGMIAPFAVAALLLPLVGGVFARLLVRRHEMSLDLGFHQGN